MMYREGRKFAGACPRCQEPLQDDARVAGVKTCPTCGGVFAGIDASQRIVAKLDRTLLAVGFEAQLGKTPPPIEPNVAIACPECLVDMQRVRIESAICEVDACPAHGTWFDPGELEAVMRAFASARSRGVHSGVGAPPPTTTASDRLPPPAVPAGALVDPGATGESPWRRGLRLFLDTMQDDDDSAL